MSLTPELIYAGRAELAEGPVWFDHALWWVDILAGTLNRLDPEKRTNTSRALDSFVGAAVPTNDGRWLVARQHDLALLEWETGRLVPYATFPGVKPQHRFNDGKCDPRGRYVGGTMSLDGTKEDGSLYSVAPRGDVRRLIGGVSISNGLAWTQDGRRMYYIDSPTQRVECFDYDADTGNVANRRTLRQFQPGEGFPDGMSIDQEGHLWVALWEGNSLIRLHGQSGETLSRVSFPARRVTSCTFGGCDHRTLFVTTAWQGMSRAERDQERLAGSLFRFSLEVGGYPVVPFRIA